MGDVVPGSLNHGSDGKRERDLMGTGDDSLGSPAATRAAVRTNRSLSLLHKCIKSFPPGLRRNVRNRTEQNRTEISNLEEKELMDGASWKRGTPPSGTHTTRGARRGERETLAAKSKALF